ncbi:MAG: META domain-containing protein [Burkholderiales bacterium]|nr:META domain-containing protein [Burkholderiales bacterium]
MSTRLRIAAVLAAALTACAAAQPTAEPAAFPLDVDLQWTGTEIGGTRKHGPGEPDRYTLRFEASGRAAIRLDCNRGAARWTRDGAKFTLSPIAGTKMNCPRGSLDVVYAGDFSRVDGWRLDGAALLLTGSVDDSAMRFVPAKP